VALENLAAVAGALAQTFAEPLYHQMNREATMLARMEAKPGRGKNCAWDVEFSGSGTADSVAEGSDVAEGEFTTDVPVPATLSWALYRAAFKLSETEVKAAASSIGTPEALVDILGDRLLLKGQQLASKINVDAFLGDGTDGSGNNTLVGFYGGALDDAGTYANINRATYTEWKSTVLANGAVPRALTIDLLNQAEEQLFQKCGRSPLWLMGSSGVRRKYSGLFEEVRRLSTDGRGPLRYEAGATELFYQGAPVLRDKDAPSGKLIMAAAEPVIEFLPALGADREGIMKRMQMLSGGNGGGTPGTRATATSIPFEIIPLAKTGNSIKFALSVEICMKITRPNAFVVIEDISEA
jgi:hypothetical protein